MALSIQDREFDEELLVRLNDFKSGRDCGEPLDQVLREIRAKFESPPRHTGLQEPKHDR